MIRLFGGGRDKGGDKKPEPAAAPDNKSPAPGTSVSAAPQDSTPSPPPPRPVSEPVATPIPSQQAAREQQPKAAGARRVLLADDSPHAQRMGERILREVGYEVITVTDGDTALMRLADADPDVVLADASLPGRSGYDICEAIKQNPRYSHVRVILTAGLLEAFDERRAESVRSDGVLKKPFESTVLTETVGRLAGAPRVRSGTVAPASAVRPAAIPSTSVLSRPAAARPAMTQPPAMQSPPPSSGIVPVRVVTDASTALPDEIDAERVRAAVTLALDAALPGMIDKITECVLVALKQKTG